MSNKSRNCLIFPYLYDGLVMHKTDNSSIVLDDV